MKTCLQMVLAVAFFGFSILAVCAQQSTDDDRKAAVQKEIERAAKPKTGKLVGVKTKTVAESLIVDPAEIRFAVVLWPEPSPTFKPIPFKGQMMGEIKSVVPLKDGGMALASSDGGYIISKNGNVEVVGKGSRCEAVAVSPAGEMAFGFTRRLPFFWTDVRGSVAEKLHTVLEIHTVEPRPRTIVVGQQSLDVSFSALAFNADGSVLMASTYPVGITLIRGGKAWNIPQSHYDHRVWPRLESNPKDAKQFLYAEFLFQLDLEKESSFTYAYVGGYKNGASDTGKGHAFSAYGNSGEIVSIKRNWKGNFAIYEERKEAEISYRDGPRYFGADRLAVHDKFIAYTALDTVMVWSRKERKIIHTFSHTSFANNGYVNAMVFRPTGGLIVAIDNGEVSEWNPETGKKLKVILKAR